MGSILSPGGLLRRLRCKIGRQAARHSLCQALHDVLRDKVGEDEVDGIFLTGAGSRLYFVHDLLLGRYGREPLACKQIQQDQSRLFDRYRDPATCCAEGAISGVM